MAFNFALKIYNLPNCTDLLRQMSVCESERDFDLNTFGDDFLRGEQLSIFCGGKCLPVSSTGKQSHCHHSTKLWMFSFPQTVLEPSLEESALVVARFENLILK